MFANADWTTAWTGPERAIFADVFPFTNFPALAGRVRDIIKIRRADKFV